MKIENLKFIVTGTGRSGSVYLAQLLSSLGVPCGHEAFFTIKMKMPLGNIDRYPELSWVSQWNPVNNEYYGHWVNKWEICADSSYIYAPFLLDPKLLSTPVIHAVRDPIKVISSMMDGGWFSKEPPYDGNWEFMDSYTNLSTEQTQLDRVCHYWIKWNRLVMNADDGRRFLSYRVEDGASPKLLSFLGVRKTENVFKNTEINRWKNRKPDLEYRDLPDKFRHMIVNMAEMWGYNTQAREKNYLFM